jgi:hypothetical protein
MMIREGERRDHEKKTKRREGNSIKERERESL